MMNFNYYIKYGIRYSLRYILKYIIRLIIFLSIIYLISFLSGKHLFISDVHAKVNSGILSPSSLQLYNLATSTPTELTMGSTTIGNGTFYGYTFGASQTRFALRYIFPSSLDTNLYYNFNFNVYSDVTSSSSFKPFTVFIRDSNGVISSCNNDSSGWNFTTGNSVTPVRNLTSVSCNNVTLSSSHFYVYISEFNSVKDGTFAISSVTYTTTAIQGQIKQQHEDSEKQLEEQKKTNDTLKDDNVDSSSNQGSSFFNDFNSGDEGSLTDIVSLPLEYVQHLNDTCKPFTITAGNLGNITIPCLSSIWSSTPFAGVINTASIIINGIICYKLLTSLFLFFKELKDPDDDKVEVMDL